MKICLLKFFREKMDGIVKQAKFMTTIVFNYTYRMDSTRTRATVLLSILGMPTVEVSVYLRRFIRFMYDRLPVLQVQCRVSTIILT
jgi:hypothetical protein